MISSDFSIRIIHTHMFNPHEHAKNVRMEAIRDDHASSRQRPKTSPDSRGGQCVEKAESPRFGGPPRKFRSLHQAVEACPRPHSDSVKIRHPRLAGLANQPIDDGNALRDSIGADAFVVGPRQDDDIVDCRRWSHQWTQREGAVGNHFDAPAEWGERSRTFVVANPNGRAWMLSNDINKSTSGPIITTKVNTLRQLNDSVVSEALEHRLPKPLVCGPHCPQIPSAMKEHGLARIKATSQLYLVVAREVRDIRDAEPSALECNSLTRPDGVVANVVVVWKVQERAAGAANVEANEGGHEVC